MDNCGIMLEFLAGTRDFSILHVQTGSGAHLAMCCFPGGVKLTTKFHLVSKLRMGGAIPLFPACVFMAKCLALTWNCALQSGQSQLLHSDR